MSPPVQSAIPDASPRAPRRFQVSEAWLLSRYRRDGDRGAREELMRRMLPLVRRVATAYASHGHHEDLLQVASLGLVKAIERYDPDFGVPLRSYAIPTMYGEVRRYLRDHSWAVRVPRPLQERVLEATKAVERLTRARGRSPTTQELADELGCELEEALEALQAGSAYSATSLDAPGGAGSEDGDRSLGERFGYDDARFRAVEDIASLRALRHLLDERDRTILYLRFVEDCTQTQIAEHVGVSQMQVSRLLRRALDRLSAAAAEAAPR